MATEKEIQRLRFAVFTILSPRRYHRPWAVGDGRMPAAMGLKYHRPWVGHLQGSVVYLLFIKHYDTNKCKGFFI